MALTETERAVCAAIAARQQQLVDELAAWVAIPTGRGFRPGLHKQRAQLARKLRGLGATTRDIPCTPRPDWLEPPGAEEQPGHAEEHGPVDVLVGEHAGSGPRLLLSGHFDTVHDPHGVFQELKDAGQGRATGPGCVDMKGGLVVAFAALAALAACGQQMRWSFVLTPDEETGSFGSAAALQELGRKHDVGLVFEPAGAGGSLITSRMGAGQFRLEAFGRSAHVGRDPEKGASAVLALCQAVAAIHGQHAPSAGRVVNVGPLVGGVTTNIVPDHALAWGNVRFADAQAEAALAAALNALQAGTGHHSGGANNAGALPRVEVRHVFNRPAKPCTPQVERLAELARACSQDLGHELPFGSTGGVCDGNTLQAVGLPVLDTLGVRGGNLHRTDEWMELASLTDRAQLAALFMLRLPDAGVVRTQTPEASHA